MTTEHLLKKLGELRAKRAFFPIDYLQRKTEKLLHFFNTSGINALVIGLSGGIDSALCASFMTHIARLPKSPIKKIVGVVAPIFGAGTSGQNTAKEQALLLCEHLSRHPCFEYHVCDLSAAYQALLAAHPFKEPSAWAEGQMASVLRTPLFYYQAAILQQQGYRSLVVGTTNRDEGAYIGFFGKASDAMVDLQPIADLHKSEVIQLAAFLDVPESILKAVPRGDVWDNRNDEQMIGAPYWFLELYQLLRCSGELEHFETTLEGDAKVFFEHCKSAIENLHQVNAHKYQVGNPAHFIDIMERKVPGGW